MRNGAITNLQIERRSQIAKKVKRSYHEIENRTSQFLTTYVTQPMVETNTSDSGLDHKQGHSMRNAAITNFKIGRRKW